jgi:hypothetical protein
LLWIDFWGAEQGIFDFLNNLEDKNTYYKIEDINYKNNNK